MGKLFGCVGFSAPVAFSKFNHLSSIFSSGTHDHIWVSGGQNHVCRWNVHMFCIPGIWLMGGCHWVWGILSLSIGTACYTPTMKLGVGYIGFTLCLHPSISLCLSIWPCLSVQIDRIWLAWCPCFSNIFIILLHIFVISSFIQFHYCLT